MRMDKIRDGGQAFPCDFAGDKGSQFGMWLRDHFAAQAMVGILAGRSAPLPIGRMVRESYEIADEMLKERSK